MKDDFMVETTRGWEQGRRGDWLINIGETLWAVIGDKDFTRIYRPYAKGDCIGPCDSKLGDAPH